MKNKIEKSATYVIEKRKSTSELFDHHIVSLIPNPEYRNITFLKQSTYLDIWCYFCQNDTND